MSASISDIVNAKIIELLLECCRKTVVECSQHYGFSAEEALSKMNLLTDFSVLCQGQDNKSVVSDISSVKSEVEVEVEGSVKSKKVSIPMPFNGICDDSKCQALKLNHGLYTQCETKKQKEKDYCKACENQAEKNNVLGTMTERMAAGIMEFKDNKGKSPTPYMKVLNKLKISKEEAEKEAGNKKVTIDNIHWTEEEVKKKVTKKVAKEVTKEEGEAAPKEEVKEVKKKVTKKVAKEEGEAAPKEEVKEVKKKVTKKAVKKEGDAASTKEEVKEEVSKEEVSKEDVKEEKPKKVSKPRVKKEKEEGSTTSSKKEKVVKEKAPKGEKGRPKKEKQETERASPIDDLFANLVAKEEEPPQVDVVNKIDFQGTTYLKSKTTGVIYTMDQDQIGKWNEQTSTIDFDEEGEEEEEEYDE